MINTKYYQELDKKIREEARILYSRKKDELFSYTRTMEKLILIFY